MTIRAVYIDLGGVLVRTEFQAPRQHLAERLGMEYEDLVKIVFDSESGLQAQKGAMTEDDHWAAILPRLHVPSSQMATVRDEFFAGDIIDRELLDELRKMKKTHRVGLISNAWSGLRPWIVSKKFDDAFDLMVISAEVGVMKPDPAIFKYALDQFDVAPAEAVFVDDFPENVAAARALGLHAVQFITTNQALAEIGKLLTAPL